MIRQRLGLLAVAAFFVAARFVVALPAVILAAILVGCAGTTTAYSYPDDLMHPNYVKRSRAVREFAERGDEARLPGAFRLLMDDQAHIRAIAADVLRELTPGGRDFGYRAHLPLRDRAGITARWRAFWLAARGGERNNKERP